jgi:hypothetical protein
MRIHAELRRIIDALASSFDFYPRTDYRRRYPHRSTSARTNAAWGRTVRGLGAAIVEFPHRHAGDR